MGHVRLERCQIATVKNKRQRLGVCRASAFTVTTESNVTAHFYLAVTDTVDHLVVFTVESMRQEAQALQHNKDGSDQSPALKKP